MNYMLEIKKPTIKLDNDFDVYIARYPVLEGNELKFYIYCAESESIPRGAEESLEKFKKTCEKIITQLNNEKLIKLSKKGKKHIIVSSYLDSNAVIEMINKCWEYINEDDCYFI